MDTTHSPPPPPADSLRLIAALAPLDAKLERGIEAAQREYGPEAAGDPFRGMHIGSGEIARLLAREPGIPILHVADGTDGARGNPIIEDARLAWLASAFGLSPFDVDVVLLALAPELDLRYERLYSYLHDDVTRKRPSVDLALNLLASDAPAKLAQRHRFSPEAPLIRSGLLQLTTDPSQPRPSLLSHALRLDEQVVRFLLGDDALDPRLRRFCVVTRTVDVDAPAVATETWNAMRALTLDGRRTGRGVRLYFHGPRGAGKLQGARALAAMLGQGLVTADLDRADAAAFDEAIGLLFRDVCFRNALLYLRGVETLAAEAPNRYRVVLERLAEDAGVTILSGRHDPIPDGRASTAIVPIAFAPLNFALRRGAWQHALETAGLAIAPDGVEALANRFRFTPGQIAGAVTAARARVRERSAARVDPAVHDAADEPVTVDDVFAAARAQSGHELAKLARRVEPAYRWNDVVLPADQLSMLRDICNHATHRHTVFETWGFDRKLSLGKGLCALFSGPPGTGKTMAAEVIASELRLDLYKIDLARIVSKYIGETEKNLDRVFTAAETSNAILFFDEADALFGKRSEVRDSHDRYANIEISYLLQKMEEYQGISILATNLRQNLDDAFLRRLAFLVQFPFPEEADRRRIWQRIWPHETPLAADVDLDRLARDLKLSGGSIKNIALGAAFLAAADGGVVTIGHLQGAARQEHLKMGKVTRVAERHAG